MQGSPFPTYSPTARPYQEAGLLHFHHCIEFREDFGNFAARIDELHRGNDSCRPEAASRISSTASE
jgi:hypothetical protein